MTQAELLEIPWAFISSFIKWEWEHLPHRVIIRVTNPIFRFSTFLETLETLSKYQLFIVLLPFKVLTVISTGRDLPWSCSKSELNLAHEYTSHKCWVWFYNGSGSGSWHIVVVRCSAWCLTELTHNNFNKIVSYFYFFSQ